MTRVGILGGGQLGLMLAEALLPLDAEVAVYDPDPAAPAGRRLPDVTARPWTDDAALRAFAARCDVVTYEFENIPAAAAEVCAATTTLWPAPHVLQTTQDRAREKEFLARAGLPHVPFRTGCTPADLEGAARDIGFPCVLKTARGGYDGKGQVLLRSAADLQRHAARLPGTAADAPGWVLEAFVALEAELSCIVARTAAGTMIVFPVFENTHREHVLDVTCVPANLPAEVCAAARAVAARAAAALDVVGLLTVEFFLGRPTGGPGAAAEPALFVNEFAPRPHNSGHVTRSACTFSQFDALARVLLGLALPEPLLLGPYAFCMGNLLGDIWLAQGRTELSLDAWRAHPAVIDVYLYGKHDPRPRRKMGHCIAIGPDTAAARRAVDAFRRDLARPPGAPRG